MSEEKYATLTSEKGSAREKRKFRQQSAAISTLLHSHKSKELRVLGIARITWEGNIKTYLKGLGSEVVEWISLTHNIN
jgi:hypothetical protein